MKEITHSKLKDLILNNLTGVTFTSLKTVTTQSALNKGRGASSMLESIGVNPDDIEKHTYLVGLISGGAVSYQDFVNNRLEKEAQAKGKKHAQLVFSAGERKWGTHVNGCNALVEHKGQYYLVLYCMANNKPQITHTLNSQPINLNESRFDQWRKPEKKEGENQGTENPIVVRDYKFSNIKEINIFGESYKVVPDPA